MLLRIVYICYVDSADWTPTLTESVRVAYGGCRTARQRLCLSHEGSGNTQGNGTVLATKVVAAQGKGGVLATKAVDTQRKSSALATKAVDTQRKSSALACPANRGVYGRCRDSS